MNDPLLWLAVAVGSALFLILVCGGMVFLLTGKVKRQLPAPVASLQSDAFIPQFKDNFAVASRYLGKVVQMTGPVELVHKTSDGKNVVVLFRHEKERSIRLIAYFHATVDLKGIKPSDVVTVQGEMYSSPGEVHLTECHLIR